MLAAAIATGVLASQQNGAPLTFVLKPPGAAPQSRLAGVDLPVLRRRLPREDAGLPAARLDARWLPHDANEVLMVFSGVLSKVGAYGFLRIALPLYPQRRRTSRR